MTRDYLPTPWAQTQALHFCLGMLVVEAVILFRFSPAAGFWAVAVWATGKEFWWDMRMQLTATWGEEWIDWTFYLSGAGLASHFWAWYLA